MANAKSKSKEVNAKQIAVLQGIAVGIVNAELEAGNSVFAATMRVWPVMAEKHAAHKLTIIREAFADAWEKALTKIKADAKANIGKAGKTYEQQMNPYYVRMSETKAIFKAFEKYLLSLSSDATKKEKKAGNEFSTHVSGLDDRKMHGGNRRDVLTMLCREYTAGKAHKVDTSPKALAAREEKRWSKKDMKVKRMEQTKNLIRFAPLAVLLNLDEFISDLIEKRKKIEAGGDAQRVKNHLKRAA